MFHLNAVNSAVLQTLKQRQLYHITLSLSTSQDLTRPMLYRISLHLKNKQTKN